VVCKDLLQEMGFKTLEEKLRQMRERGGGIKEFKLKEFKFVNIWLKSSLKYLIRDDPCTKLHVCGRSC